MKLEFPQQMAQQFGLPVAGKAIRCLINYVCENPSWHAEIFDEVRCQDC